MNCIQDKKLAYKLFDQGLLLRSNQIFIYENLPQSIDPKRLELTLQNKGKIYLVKHEDRFVICDTFSEVGSQNEYGDFTEVNIINPYIQSLNKKYSIYGLSESLEDKAIQIKNNMFSTSILDILSKYKELIIESELSLRSYILNSRNMFTLFAGDNKSKQNCEIFLKRLEKGELSVLSDNAFIESIKLLPNNNNGEYGYKLLQIIQYLKASCLNEIGINANYEIKRSVTSKADVDLSLDYLIPLVDNMFQYRQRFTEDFNNCYGENVRVLLHSTWLNERLKAEELIHENMSENMSENTENETINSDNESEKNNMLNESESEDSVE